MKVEFHTSLESKLPNRIRQNVCHDQLVDYPNKCKGLKSVSFAEIVTLLKQCLAVCVCVRRSYECGRGASEHGNVASEGAAKQTKAKVL